jgi:hypothetical protein
LSFELQAEPLSSAHILDESNPAYHIFLPPQVRTEITKELQKIDFSERNLSSQPAVTFTSRESKFSTGFPVVNRVSFFLRERFDIWVMRQHITGSSPRNAQIHTPSNPPVANWAFVAIVVDKSTLPHLAYYLELAPQDVPLGALPAPRPMRAPCSQCHSSGPRLLRPDRSQGSVPLSAETLDLIATWNQRIASYRRVVDFASEHELQRFPRFEKDDEALPVAACHECHNNETGVRQRLTRWNKDAIEHLLKVGAMPLEDSALHAASKECVSQWLAGNKLPSKCLKKQNKKAENLAQKSKRSKIHLEALSVSIKGDLNDFEVNNLRLVNKNMACSDDKCRLTTGFEWGHARTGISLRDTHLGSWVKENKLNKLTLSLTAPWPFPADDSSVKSHLLQISLDAKNSSLVLPLTLTLQCVPAVELKKHNCTFSTPGFSLEPMGWKMPCFLGACVREIEKVEGRMQIFE